MKGDDRKRHCARCKLNVFNVEDLTEQEVRALFVKTEGRVCGRIYKRADGTVLTRDCPTGLGRIRRKVLAALAMAATLVLSIVGSRWNAERSCGTGVSGGWFSRLFDQRLIDARETLRQTRTFGPVIDALSPLRYTTGRMVQVQPVGSAPESKLE